MNITTGGPHILLFERDQQLVALLGSELQLAGYECHTARTAVEVFDAIARYPVRLVLVNLAQAAAARREFWVALDTQRRGRGVQVLTFHCYNLAGYGPSSDDPDEQTNTVLADMEVDGMLGIVNMVNAIRSRLATSNTGAMSRLAANTNASSPPGGQATLPIPAVSPVNANPASAQPLPTPMSPSAQADFSRAAAPNHTDKIRAVIYPNQRTWSTARENIVSDGQTMQAREQQPVQETSWSSRGSQQAGMAATPAYSPSTADTAVNRLSQAQAARPAPEQSYPNESSLAQLSRMLEEQRPPLQEAISQERGVEQGNRLLEETAVQQRIRPEEPLSTMTLRASPIQDMPTDRVTGTSGQSDMSSHTSARRYDEFVHPNYTQPTASPALMSIATPVSPVSMPAPAPAVQSVAAKSASSALPRDETPSQKTSNELDSTIQKQYAQREPSIETKREERSAREERSFEDNERQVGQVQTRVMEEEAASTFRTPDNALLLNIVQSLPPMPSPPPQPQVLNGRATRSLGSVLLEGHLVAEDRLEVAHNIQRMLRGVDMNYQLGEILLIFKLLTPDQLLAASLVSYGLITATQISALGRIRQELHAIGLEYDLENLLILFRILTSEQLREVRSNWV